MHQCKQIYIRAAFVVNYKVPCSLAMERSIGNKKILEGGMKASLIFAGADGVWIAVNPAIAAKAISSASQPVR
jgi:hypothetical protein